MTRDDSPKETFLRTGLNYWICLMLVITTLFVYRQVLDFDFISFDDSIYVTENRYVRQGLTLKGLNWAVNVRDRDYLTYWHPMAWLSHMLDYQLFRLNAGMHHFTSLVFHVANTLLLFLVFRRMTGAMWQSAFVAALFALHPLNVESVAWVSERKNVLSTFFWLLTMFSYTTYTESPSLSRYLLTFLIFILGLTAKPMLVTLPFVLLLLDYWPLGRFGLKGATPAGKDDVAGPFSQRRPVARLIFEKIPLLCFSLVVVYLSSTALQSFHSMVIAEKVPLKLRIFNALVSYANYILKMMWPQKLAVLYPFPESVSAWQVGGAVLFLCGVSFLVISKGKKQPYLVTGWLWYLGTLIPVIGLVQAGLWPEMADRWAYIPLIGIFSMIAWGVPEAFSGWQPKKTVLAVMGATALIILMGVTRGQVRYWKSSATLYEHTLGVTDRNYFIHNNLGVAQKKQGNLDGAIQQYQKALKINPKHVSSLNNLGNALEVQGRIDEAADHYLEALRIDPNVAITYNNLGNIFAKQGRMSEAVQYYEKSLQIDINYKEAHYNLGNALSIQGRLDEAIHHYHEALRLDPGFFEAAINMGNTLYRLERIPEAIRFYTRAIQIDPDSSLAYNNLREILAVQADINKAVLEKRQALKQNPKNADAHYDLGEAYRKKGKLDKAAVHYQMTLSIDPGRPDALKKLAIIYAKQGKYRMAREYFYSLIALQPNQWEAYYYVAGTYARQNRIDESIQWVQYAVARGFDNWNLLKTDPNLAKIRTTPYYNELLRNR